MVFQMKSYRKMLRIPYTEHRANENIQKAIVEKKNQQQPDYRE